MIFMYIFRRRKGGALMHVYVWEHKVIAFTTELLNECLRNLVGMKCSWPPHALRCFGYIHPGANPGYGKNWLGGEALLKKLLFQAARLQQPTECIAMI